MGIVIALLDIVQMLLWVLSIVIIAQAIFSWLVVFNVVNTRSDFVRAVWTALEKITEPMYRPIRITVNSPVRTWISCKPVLAWMWLT